MMDALRRSRRFERASEIWELPRARAPAPPHSEEASHSAGRASEMASRPESFPTTREHAVARQRKVAGRRLQPATAAIRGQSCLEFPSEPRPQRLGRRGLSAFHARKHDPRKYFPRDDDGFLMSDAPSSLLQRRSGAAQARTCVTGHRCFGAQRRESRSPSYVHSPASRARTPSLVPPCFPAQ